MPTKKKATKKTETEETAAPETETKTATDDSNPSTESTEPEPDNGNDSPGQTEFQMSREKQREAIRQGRDGKTAEQIAKSLGLPLAVASRFGQ